MKPLASWLKATGEEEAPERFPASPADSFLAIAPCLDWWAGRAFGQGPLPLSTHQCRGPFGAGGGERGHEAVRRLLV